MPRMTLQQAMDAAIGLYRAGRLDEAEHVFRQLRAAEPDDADALRMLGRIAYDRGHYGDAIALLSRASALEPDVAEYRCDLGNALRNDGRLDEAFEAYRSALARKPELVVAWKQLGIALALAGRTGDAIDAYRRGLAVAPDDAALHSYLILTLHYHPAYDGPAILAECRRWAERHGPPASHRIGPHANERDPERRLRVGYVSANFFDHACAFFSTSLLAFHDPEQVEVFCYSDAPLVDDVTRRHRAHADVWRETASCSDRELQGLVRNDRIDVLVDLMVHTPSNRLAVFARKPAPVQLTWLGYAGTTGLDTVDYRLSDRFLDPPGAHDDHYSEETVRLPDSFWCFDPRTPEPAPNALPAATNGLVTFGSLSSFSKVNDDVLALWARVLRAVPGSRLVVLADPGAHRRRTLDVLAAHGADPACVEFANRRRRPAYLALYHRLDVALDTFPWTGGTTTLDALWMGVPVVTLPGRTAVSRGSTSLLMNAGLPELVARDPDDFVAIAAGLARDPSRLAALRATLRERLQRSPLMDGPRFARNVESAYRAMWRRWCATPRAEASAG